MRDRPRLPNPADDDSDTQSANAADSASTRRESPEKRQTAGTTDGGKGVPEQSASPPTRPTVDADRRRSTTPVDSADATRSPAQGRLDAKSRLEQAKLDARQMAAEIRAARALRPADATAELPRRPREPEPGSGRRRDSKPPGLDALLEYRDQRLRQEKAARDNGLQDLLDYRDERARLEQQRARRAGYDDMRRPSPPEPDEPVPSPPQPTGPSSSTLRRSVDETAPTTDESEHKTAGGERRPRDSQPIREATETRDLTGASDDAKKSVAHADPHDPSANSEDSPQLPGASHKPDQIREVGTIKLSSTNQDHRPPLDAPPPNSVVEVDGRFRYETDDEGQVVKASATLTIVDLDHPRDRQAERTLVGKLPGDHAGHLFARIFQGPMPKINLTPMEGAKVNLGQYKTLENRWRREIESGGTVDVELDLKYGERRDRPDTIVVFYRLSSGEQRKVRIRNTPRDEGLG